MLPTFVLAIRGMGSSQPHQSYEQHHRPRDLHEQPTLEQEQPSSSDHIAFLSVDSNAFLYRCLNAVFEKRKIVFLCEPNSMGDGVYL